MDLQDIYENVDNDGIKETSGPRTLNPRRDEGKTQKSRGSRRLVLMTVCLGIICVLLLLFIILQHIFIKAERESLFKSHKNTVEEFNQTINRLQDNYTDLMTEKHQLKNNFNQKKLELETRVKDLTAEKSQLQGSVDALNRTKLELETELRKLNERGKGWFFISSEMKSWSESRQDCRDGGGDLVIINTEEKQRFISSLVKDFVWIGLSDIENEGNMKWVDNSPLKRGFWNINEPNNAGGNEDCVELNPGKPNLNNWNDIPCSEKRKWVCGK